MEREEIDARNGEIAERFKRGQTQRQIGNIYGISDKRVGQILSKMGYTQRDGGSHVRKRDAERLAKIEEDKIYRKRSGLSKRDKVRIAGNAGDPNSLYERFTRQRQNARTRGIEWELTFAAWWYLWCLYDKCAQRGRGRGKYVMARHGDSGPYSINNCKIIPSEENSSERWTNKTT